MTSKSAEKELRSLASRPNIVRTTVRTLGIGLSAFAIYNTAFSLYNHNQQRRFLREGTEVIHRAEALVDSLQQERAYLLPAGNGSVLDAVVEELRALRGDLRGECAAPRPLERGRYLARMQDCVLFVTIPRGGSLSEASEMYFGDHARWKADRGRNRHIIDPDRIHPGTQYRFYTR